MVSGCLKHFCHFDGDEDDKWTIASLVGILEFFYLSSAGAGAEANGGATPRCI